MPNPNYSAAGDASNSDSASDYFEIGKQALRQNDPEMAKIMLGVAEKMWEREKDSENASRARAFSSSF